MDKQDWKLYELKAEVLQAMAHPIRLAILDLLKDGEVCVCDIASRIGAQRSNVSRHLSVMLKAGVVEVRKDGLRMLYTLRTPCVLKFVSCVADVLHAKVESEAATLRRQR
ncbi:MAG: hypothetical protein A3K19_29250 [Lentisphaerae bacterium RIFOXYB12_FULL_65_16]|nr:MAG: hypothetical protein A3K18_13395 [Lentisphaerae bacterium RIFOXYA12_64_32]OGV88390.1 MAG: hypothetical protein A3K19_29250 [Lentisphaerae bacterium RIFOXYB12_FULL_65_16]